MPDARFRSQSNRALSRASNRFLNKYTIKNGQVEVRDYLAGIGQFVVSSFIGATRGMSRADRNDLAADLLNKLGEAMINTNTTEDDA